MTHDEKLKSACRIVADIEEMIRHRATRSPSIVQMVEWRDAVAALAHPAKPAVQEGNDPYDRGRRDVLNVEPGGFIVTNATGTRFRKWVAGVPTWTNDRKEAVRYARREDAEAVHFEDDEIWFIQPFIQEEI